MLYICYNIHRLYISIINGKRLERKKYFSTSLFLCKKKISKKEENIIQYYIKHKDKLTKKSKKLIEEFQKFHFNKQQQQQQQQQNIQQQQQKEKNIKPFKKNNESKNQIFKKTPVIQKIIKMMEENKIGKFRNKSKEKLISKESFIDKIFTSSFKFIAAAQQFISFPQEKLPEIVMMGRSNVGKSSLINSLTESSLVKISPKPGTTRTINWFYVSSYCAIVDFPGYGFAFAKEEKISNWLSLIKQYFESRKVLKRVFILIDARIGFKNSDIEIINYLEKINIKYQIILTKCDLVFQKELAKRYFLIEKEILTFKNCVKKILMVSSKNKSGISELRNEIFQCISKNIKKKELPKNSLYLNN